MWWPFYLPKVANPLRIAWCFNAIHVYYSTIFIYSVSISGKLWPHKTFGRTMNSNVNPYEYFTIQLHSTTGSYHHPSWRGKFSLHTKRKHISVLVSVLRKAANGKHQKKRLCLFCFTLSSFIAIVSDSGPPISRVFNCNVEQSTFVVFPTFIDSYQTLLLSHKVAHVQNNWFIFIKNICTNESPTGMSFMWMLITYLSTHTIFWGVKLFENAVYNCVIVWFHEVSWSFPLKIELLLFQYILVVNSLCNNRCRRVGYQQSTRMINNNAKVVNNRWNARSMLSIQSLNGSMLHELEGASVNTNTWCTTFHINHTMAAKKLCSRVETGMIGIVKKRFQLVYKLRIKRKCFMHSQFLLRYVIPILRSGADVFFFFFVSTVRKTKGDLDATMNKRCDVRILISTHSPYVNYIIDAQPSEKIMSK